jgi:hypothetical protein
MISLEVAHLLHCVVCIVVKNIMLITYSLVGCGSEIFLS